jgi:WD40 repeat protein
MRHLWAGALDNMIYVYNTNSSELELVETLKGHTDMVYGILKVDGDDVVWSGSRDCSVRTWSF